MRADGTTIPDGTHDLCVYKVCATCILTNVIIVLFISYSMKVL